MARKWDDDANTQTGPTFARVGPGFNGISTAARGTSRRGSSAQTPSGVPNVAGTSRGATNPTRVAWDPKAEPDCGEDGYLARDSSYLVREVPRILRAKKWNTAAWFQTIWQGGLANQLVGRASDGQGSDRPLRVVPIKMRWVLTFDRASDMLDDISQPSVFAEEPARSVLIANINKVFKQANSDTVQFGNLSATGRALEDEYVNYRALSKYHAYELDELTAALGLFTFYVIPSGTASRDARTVSVSINRIGIYLRDSFDFNGEQFLGVWRLPDTVLTDPPGGQIDALRLYPRCSTSMFEMTNSAYRKYRGRTGYGEDFLVYSDVYQLDLKQVVAFSYRR